jgi:hypothetical protein
MKANTAIVVTIEYAVIEKGYHSFVLQIILDWHFNDLPYIPVSIYPSLFAAIHPVGVVQML